MQVITVNGIPQTFDDSDIAAASDGKMLPLPALNQTLTSDANGNITGITVTYAGNTYKQTITYSGNTPATVSQWVKQ